MIFLSSMIAFIVTALMLTLILFSGLSKVVQDIPNERSLHQKPVPRTGGIGLLLGTLAGWSLMFSSLAWWIVMPLLALFLISILDDIYCLPVKIRLLVHIAAAAILVFGCGVIAEYGLLTTGILFFFAVWMTNLYNFMDGSDGLAGGMALFGFTSYGIAALFVQDDVLAWANFTIAAAGLGFLLFNFHPAKIFMGDAGSIPLGFLSVAMGVWGWQREVWAVWFPLMVFSPFIVDATTTLVKRTLRGARITEAHREHYYQRIIQMGVGHRTVALLEYVLMFLAGLTALWLREFQLPWLGFSLMIFAYAALMIFLDIRWSKFERTRI